MCEYLHVYIHSPWTHIPGYNTTASTFYIIRTYLSISYFFSIVFRKYIVSNEVVVDHLYCCTRNHVGRLLVLLYGHGNGGFKGE